MTLLQNLTLIPNLTSDLTCDHPVTSCDQLKAKHVLNGLYVVFSSYNANPLISWLLLNGTTSYFTSNETLPLEMIEQNAKSLG